MVIGAGAGRADVLEVRWDGVLMGCADRMYGCQLLHII